MQHCKSFLKALALVGVVAFVSSAAAETHYVVPDGQGDGTSWANGASLESVLENLADGDVVKLKQGVYKVTSSYAIAGIEFSILGGYAGVSEAEEPSADKFATVITADADLDNVWAWLDPETGVEEVVLEAGEPMKVVKDGALNLPPDYVAGYDVYYPVHCAAGAISVCSAPFAGFLSLGAETAFTLKNLTFSGFGVTGGSLGAIIHHTAGSSAALRNVIEDIAFVGNSSSVSLYYNGQGADNALAHVARSEFKFNRLAGGAVFYVPRRTLSYTFTNCVFESIFAGTGVRTSPVIYQASASNTGQGSFQFSGCAFRRVAHCNTANESTSVSISALLVDGGTTGPFWFTDCDFEDVWDEDAVPHSLIHTSGGKRLDGCRFLRNRLALHSSATGHLVAPWLLAAEVDIVDHTVVVSNSFRCAAPAAASVSAAPIAVTYGLGTVAGSVFADNELEIVSSAEGARVSTARAILALATGVNSGSGVAVLDSTFTGDAPGDDICYRTQAESAYFKEAENRRKVVSSVLWTRHPTYAYSGLVLEGGHGALTAQRCVIRGCGESSSAATFLDCHEEDPSLKFDPATWTYRPTVAVDGVLGNTANWYYIASGNSWQNRDVGTTNLWHQNNRKGVTFFASGWGDYTLTGYASSLMPREDLFGSLRADNNATIGACECDFPEGDILSVLPSPASAGTVTIGSQYAKDGKFAAVTAVATDPSFAFSHWEDAGGNVISDSATYEFPDAAAYTRVKAVFAAPEVEWTFRCEEGKGVFTNGETSVVFKLQPGDVAPVPPVVAADTAWHWTGGWSPAVPALVGSSSLEFTAAMIPYTQVVYYDSHATGANNGTSWADAFTSFKTAVATAANGVYVGEVRVRQGRHLLTASTAASFSNVRIIGGWTGNGDERSDNRRLTVITGDTNGDDAFVDQNGETVGLVYENGSFIAFRKPTAAEGYWDLVNYSDNCTTFYSADDTVACTNSRLECVTATGFGGDWGNMQATGIRNNVTFTNCDFIAYNSSCPMRFKTSSTVVDCGFYGRRGPVMIFAGQSASDVLEVRACKFLHYANLRFNGAYPEGVTSSAGSVWLDDCEFGHYRTGNYLAEGTANNATASRVIFYSTGATSRMRNCYVHDIDVMTHREMPLVVTSGQLEGCRFENCRSVAVYGSAMANKNVSAEQVEAGFASNCTFRSCSVSYVGDEAGLRTTLLRAGGVSGCTFTDCRVDSAMKSGTAVLWLGNYKSCTGFNEFRNCSVTNTASAYNNSYDCAGLIVCRKWDSNAITQNGAIGALSVRDCEVCAPNLYATTLLCDICGANGASVVGNRVIGGAVESALIRAHVDNTTNPTFINFTVADNSVSGFAAEAAAATVLIRNHYMRIGWSTFARNVAPWEFHAGSWQAPYLTSSVVWSENTLGSYNANAQPLLTRSCLRGFGADDCQKGSVAYEETPQFAARPTRTADRRRVLRQLKTSPYVREVESFPGSYDASLAATDAEGVARPEEGVVIGAAQTPGVDKGLAIFVR